LFWKIALFVSLDLLSGIFSFLFLLFYCYLIGFEYPLLRSLFTTGFGFFSLYFGKQRGLEILFLSAAFILCFFPNAIYDISFQLSFAGVLGIYCFNFNFNKKNWINKILSNVFTTFAASLAITPISIYQFHIVSFQPFLANFLAIPYVTLLLTPLSLLWIFLSFFNLEFYITFLLNFLFEFFIFMAKILSQYGVNISFMPIDLSYIFIYIVCLIVFASFKEKFRFFILFLGTANLLYGLSYSEKKFILVHSYAIGYFAEGKIYVYPKCNFVSKIWEEAYHMKAVDGKNTSYFEKDSCGKLVIDGKFGLIMQPLNGVCKITTKDFYVTYAQLQNQVKKIVI